jgi:hypothetical protein
MHVRVRRSTVSSCYTMSIAAQVSNTLAATCDSYWLSRTRRTQLRATASGTARGTAPSPLAPGSIKLDWEEAIRVMSVHETTLLPVSIHGDHPVAHS